MEKEKIEKENEELRRDNEIRQLVCQILLTEIDN